MADNNTLVFNPPPGWPKPPTGWRPPASWRPDPSWPPPPEGWQLWVAADAPEPKGDATHPAEAAPAPTKPAPSTTPEATRIALLEAENAQLRQQLSKATSTAEPYIELNDSQVLQDVGIYRYHHPLENAAAFRDRLTDLEARIADLVAADRAIVKSNAFTLDNSLAKGRRMTNDLAKLMLRAYNAEADNSIRSLKLGNVQTAKRRWADPVW